MRKTYVFALAAAIAAAAPMLAQTKDLKCSDNDRDGRLESYCEIREQTIAGTGSLLQVDSRPNGGISVKGWDRADILVRAKVETRAGTQSEAQSLAGQVHVETAGAQIHATGPASERDRHWSVSYEVFVPQRTPLSLLARNGGIRIAGVTADIAFDSTNGGVSLSGLGGYVHGKTTNGGLHIELAGSRWEGQGMDVATTNGGVHLTVPSSYSAHLEVGTTNGGLHFDVPVTVSGRLGRTVSTDLGSGGANLKIMTVNGGVHVGRSDS